MSSTVSLALIALVAAVVLALLARALFVHRMVRNADAVLEALRNERKDWLLHDPELRRVVRVYQVAKLREDMGRNEGSLLASASALINAYQTREESGAAARASSVVGWR